jgi:type II secretory pathway component PulK
MRNQRGIALILTLLIVALLTITVVEFFYSAEVDSRMARNAVHGLQASLLARSGIALGEAFLLKDEDPLADAFTEEWCPAPAREGRSCQIEDGGGQVVIPQGMRLRVEIFDESAKINVNLTRPRSKSEWLANKTRPNPNAPLLFISWTDVLGRIFQAHGVNPEAATAIGDYWNRIFEQQYGQDGNSNGTPGPTPSPISRTPSPGVPQQPIDRFNFAALDDIAGIAGSLSPSDLRRIRPAVTALRGGQLQVNANTASREVLTAILGDGGAVDNIISERQSAPLKQADLLSAISSVTSTDPSYRNAKGMVGVRSSFYLIRASAIVNVNPITGHGGISRSAEMLVQRTQRPVRPGAPGGTLVSWTLVRLNWQKEGGATLFRPEMESGSGDSLESTSSPER